MCDLFDVVAIAKYINPFECVCTWVGLHQSSEYADLIALG